MNIFPLLTTATVALLAGGCHAAGSAPAAHSDGDGHNHAVVATATANSISAAGEHTDEIAFTTAQALAVGLQTETVAPATFCQVIKTSGQILSAQGDEATVVATSGGTVTFARSSMTDGAAVRAGEAIVTISAKTLQEGDPIAKAQIEYAAALKDYQRAEALVATQIISDREFEQIRLRYQTSKVVYEAQASHADADGVRVTSPMSGYLKRRLVSQGEYVSVGQPIATIAQNRRLQLRAEVAEQYFGQLHSIAGANFKMPYNDRVCRLADMNGRLLSFGKNSDAASFYIPITFEFDNVGDVLSGSFVEVYLLAAPLHGVISVPVSALIEEQGVFSVFVRLDQEGYRKQEVTLGATDGERVQTLSGLSAGDQVVTRGVYQVKLAATSSQMPEAHTH